MSIAILLGILSTIQVHLAKAFERQGIEVLSQIRARLQNTGERVQVGAPKPLIYTAGVILNNTAFIYPLLAQPHAPPAIFTSMFGIGLVVLMLYAAKVLRERITRAMRVGAGAIVAGTLVIGVENVWRGEFARAAMNVHATLFCVGVFCALGLGAVFAASRRGDQNLIGLAFGFFAGGCGSLDPFLKGVAQNLSGQPQFVPDSPLGWAIFAPSFVIGFLAFLITQIGFAKKAPASVLVPMYNSTYILLPVLLQLILLPAYRLYASTLVGVALILVGVVFMRGLRR